MSDIVLVGPFWTRAETAEYLGIAPEDLQARRDVLRLEGRWLEETYPALQFAGREVRYDVAVIVESLRDELPGTAIADWLTRPNQALGALSPLQWFDSGQDVNTALQVAHADIESAASRVVPLSRIAAAAG
ncbi:MAG: DUF2384 domain-containing protein [Acidimicrobiia bacterium]|nr:DUF2384 domain-containing protein [Acidimicrobiia bacterium]